MRTNIVNIKGASVLSRNQLKTIKGMGGIDLTLCGCSCSGAVTGPKYCSDFISCPQIQTC